MRKFALFLALLAAPASAQVPPTDLTQVDLEDLMNLRVTTASKKEQRIARTAAAVYVITPEDIRSSGATSIPEILRLVPGLDVGRIDANLWAISARGFNGRFANKMLVLIDGRSVYTPLFAGVNWDVQDMLLEDVDRIEVIRGPGGALWGANALNAVINIITKRAEATQGSLITAGAGTEERGFGSVRYGGKLNPSAYYRIYAKYVNRDNLLDLSGNEEADQWDSFRGGFRTDWAFSPRDSLTLQGDIYNGRRGSTISETLLSPPFEQVVRDRGTVGGGNLLARWKRAFPERSDMAVQLYYDRADRKRATLKERVDTLDLDFQHHFAPGTRQDVVWGFGYRLVADDTRGSFRTSFDPRSFRENLITGFAQDEIALARDRLYVILGSKLEHNPFSGFEAQPSVRMVWTPRAQHAIWTAVSRAVRTPSRREHVRVNLSASRAADGTTILVSRIGKGATHSEGLLAYEVGYRSQLHRRLSADLAAFYNSYSNVLTTEPGPPFFEHSPPPPHLVIPMFLKDDLEGPTYGVELALQWRPSDSWKLAGSYSLLEAKLRNPHLPAGRPQPDELRSPRHQFQLRSNLQLPRKFTFDTSLYFVGRIASQNIPSYARLDTQVRRRLTESVGLSVVGQNLLSPRHPEFVGDGGVLASQVRRSVYGALSWQF